MKYIIFLLLSITLFASENNAYDTKFGFLYKGTILSNFKDAQDTLAEWVNETASIDNGKVTVKYYSNSNLLYKDYKKDKLDMIILNLDFFFKNKKEIDSLSSNYWTLLSNDVNHTQFYLIANTSSNINSFKDLKGKSISLKDEAITAEIWLEKKSLLINKKSHKKILGNIQYLNKKSTTLLNVFFKKTDAAIVTKDTWETMSELNPAIKKKVKVIEKSSKIHLPFIAMFSKNADVNGKKSFINLSKDIFKLERGAQISDLLEFDTLHWIKDNELNELEVYYNEYFSLKKKYK